MTTTLSSPATGSDSVASDAFGSEPFRPQAKAGRVKFWLAILAGAMGLVGGLSWAGMSWTRAARHLALTDKFLVARRSFSVVLTEKGELQAAKSADVVCEVEGRSTIIYLIPEGTSVQEGDLLVELASDQIVDRIRQEELKEANAVMAHEAAKAELEIQRDKNLSDIRKGELRIELSRLALEKYEKGDWLQALKDAEIEIERASIALARRTEGYEAAKELFAKDFITKTEYQQDEFEFTKAQWELDKARMSLEVLKTYTHVADLRQRESDFEEAVKECERVKKGARAEETRKLRSFEGKTKELELVLDQLAKLRTQEEKCRIFAPTQGFVVYYSQRGRHFMSGENQIREGGTVHERQVLLTLPDTSQMIVVVRVHEAKTDKLHMGQRVNIKVEGLPGRQFSGTVTKIAVVADTQNRWLNPDLKEYETEIKLDLTDAPLKPGVTAHCEILVEMVEDKLAVPVQTVYTKGGRRYAFRQAGREIIATEVRLGAIGTEWAEIKEGLSDGEQILLAFSDEHKRLVPDLPPATRGRRMREDGAGHRPQNVPSPGESGAGSHAGRPGGSHGKAMRSADHTRSGTQSKSSGTP